MLKMFPIATANTSVRKMDFPMFREHGEHSCVHYLGHTQWGQGGSAQAGWWHRTTADTGNSLQGPEKAIFCKMVLRLSSGLCTAPFTLCCMNWLYPGVTIVIFSFIRRWAWWPHAVCLSVYMHFPKLWTFGWISPQFWQTLEVSKHIL